jgi:hypothetical protein
MIAVFLTYFRTALRFISHLILHLEVVIVHDLPYTPTGCPVWRTSSLL